MHTFIFNLTADVSLEQRPGFTLIVDEFQNFATDEYAKLFEQGRKYKVKQFLAHQHRQQLKRSQTAETNLAATLTATTIVAFRTSTHDSRELASLYSGIASQRRPTDIAIHPLEKIDQYPHPLVKQFVLDVVDKLDDASGQKLWTRSGVHHDDDSVGLRIRHGGWALRRRPPRTYTYKVNPEYDFGAGSIQTDPKKAEQALTLLSRLIYESEEREEVAHPLRQQFIDAVTPFWKLKIETLDSKKPYEVIKEALEAKTRYTRFVRLLDAVLAILIHSPIAEDMDLSNTDIAAYLSDLEKREAFVKIGSSAYSMKTRDTSVLYSSTATNARARHSQVQRQTRERFCIPRSELETREPEPLRETQDTPEQDISSLDLTEQPLSESPEPAYEPLPERPRQEKPTSPRSSQRGKPTRPKAQPEQQASSEPDDTPWQPYTEL